MSIFSPCSQVIQGRLSRNANTNELLRGLEPGSHRRRASAPGFGVKQSRENSQGSRLTEKEGGEEFSGVQGPSPGSYCPVAKSGEFHARKAWRAQPAYHITTRRDLRSPDRLDGRREFPESWRGEVLLLKRVEDYPLDAEKKARGRWGLDESSTGERW